MSFLTLSSVLYAEAARWRRRWHARHPDVARRLARPVISVGNLRVGGSAKTPVVGHLASLLRDWGERPAVLSRGYGRRDEVDGVVVVSDGVRVRADLARAGDEPLMLARSLDGVSVLVARDRFLAGRVAEDHLGASVHLLDDGFQHFALARDIDLVLVDPGDLEDARTLPAGRLREPVDSAAAASAILAIDGSGTTASDLVRTLTVPPRFVVGRSIDTPLLLEPFGSGFQPPADARVLAVAGIARPDVFFAHLREARWNVVDTLAFRDHHRFSRRDVARILSAASACGADFVVTTEKDAIRLLPHRPIAAAVAWVPLRVTVEPAAAFRQWLQERLTAVRAEAARRRPPEEGRARGSGPL